MFDCTTNEYDSLYARWLDKPGILLDLCGYDPMSHKLLDLCGGTGAVSREALRRGAKWVALADLNPRVSDIKEVSTLRCHAEDAHRYFNLETFDRVVLRQALGYLHLEDTFRSVYHLLKPGGRFAFNSFSRPKWAWKSYEHEGVKFREASGYLGKTVVHLQMRSLLKWDVSVFRWHTEDEIRAALNPYFVWDEISSGGSTRWVCRR